MKVHADKNRKYKEKATVSTTAQKRSETTSAFADNRPETVMQLKLQAEINNSPRVKQLMYLREMADNSPRVRQLKAIQEMAYADFKADPVPLQKNRANRRLMPTIQQKASSGENKTGLPDPLKAGIENLSGYTMNDVKVHYNSDKPLQLQAHAYTQGTAIHLGPGQKKHLPHEAWHVVQQKQGRVRPTLQMKGIPGINDDKILEKEADIMGKLANGTVAENTQVLPLKNGLLTPSAPVQRMQSFSSFSADKTVDEDKITNENLEAYLKEVFKPVKNKANKIRSEDFYKEQVKYRKIVVAAGTIGSVYQELFDIVEMGSGKKHKISDIENILKKCEEEVTIIEPFKIDEKEISEGYEKAEFKGDFKGFVNWLGELTSEEPYSKIKGANAVMSELYKNFPLLFKWVKGDIMSTRDHKFWIKEDPHEDRTASAGAIRKAVEEYGLKYTEGPEKIAMDLGGEKVAVVKGLALDEVDDFSIDDKFSGIPLETILEMGFLILTTGVGDAAPVNVRKLKGSGKYAFIDTGGNYAYSKNPDSDIESPIAKIEENYKAFLSNLGEAYDGKLKKWEEIKEPPKTPEDLKK